VFPETPSVSRDAAIIPTLGTKVKKKIQQNGKTQPPARNASPALSPRLRNIPDH
jgi:hypothetical protein